MTTQTKPCSKCGQILPFTEFHPRSDVRDGTYSWCKACNRAYQKARNQTPAGKAYNKARNQAPKRKAYKKVYNRARIRTPEYKAYMKKKRATEPEKFKARNILNYAIRQGELQRLPCIQCGNPKSQAHHEDYTKPLEVEWLCFICHRKHRHGQQPLTE